MADNSHGYGQYIGHYPPNPSYPTILGSPSGQPPYSYPAPGNGVVTPANYAASHNAYDHNLNRIPGLGLGGTQMLPATTLSANTSQPWPTQGYNSFTNNFLRSQQHPPASLTQQPPASYPQPYIPLEDGELGEFEDLYDPKDSINIPQDVSQVAPQAKPTRPLNNLDSRNGSVGDAEGSSIYDPHDPHVIQDNAVSQAMENPPADVEQDYPMDDDWEPSYPDRERSGSYSPYLSPREVHRKISMAKATSRDTQATDHVPATSISDILPKSNGITPASAGLPSKPPAASSASSEHENPTNGSSLPRSPLEAKKKAQEAILGLWPLKVRYQDYIEEGIDAKVVKALFKDIGLDVPVSKTNSAGSQTTSDAPATPVQAAPTNIVPHKPQSSLMRTIQVPLEVAKQPDNKDNKDKGGEVKVTQKSAAEERKDKIARKLAAMAQKTTTAQSPGQGASVPVPVSVPSPVPVPVSAPAPAAIPTTITPPASTVVVASAGIKSDATNTSLNVSKTRAENNAKLQQKLAILRRQQAQSAADKAQAASNESTAISSPARMGPSPLNTDRNDDSTPKSRSAIPVQQSETQQISSTTPQANRNDEGIPGLSLQSLALPQPQQGSTRSLKRPVASDFDNYTPRSDTLKRTRIDERLVIDVSDDEDVEMEIGSPTDDLPPSVDSGSATTRQALSSFPPLSDGPSRRQQDSPVSSSAPTPPIHGARVDVLNKRIEDLKRQIAEAEAKTAAKKATTQLSPRPSSPVVEQTISVPKLADRKTRDTKANHNRRDRIVSYELPRVSAALKEKQDKLRQIVAEAARLELEVQASLDEEQKLKAEMEELAIPSTTNSPELDEQQPISRDVSSPEPTVASNSQHNAKDERSVKSQSSHDQQSPLPETMVDVGTEPNNDESLQASDTINKTNTIDLEMVDADLPAPGVANITPVVEATPKGDDSPSALDAHGLAQPHMTETMGEMKQNVEGLSTNTNPEAKSVTESAAPAVSSSPSEPEDESSESDVSMQQSVPDLSQSDDDTYEPTPVEISDSHVTREKNAQQATEEFDDIPEEPSPNHTSIDQEHQRSEQTSNEVKNRSSEEPLLLTTSQDGQNHKPPLEDLLTYKSPLSYFRAYRFHPKYFEEVSGGLKSMTFNARIDPMREVCPQVLAGEPCPKGSNCEYQHFDSMVLQDAEIITQLGSADMFIGETRTKFIEGLKRVLNDLKANRVKDFDRITKAIVKHRQEFLGDKTKVLALDSSAS